MAKGDDLSNRLASLAIRIIRLSGSMPKTTPGNHIAKQILRSGTASGANYEEARGAESHADFVHKLGIVLKELKETRYWLKLTRESGLVKANRLELITQECEELCAIVGRSIATAKKSGRNEGRAEGH